MTDAELIDRLADADDTAFAELFDRHGPAVLRYAQTGTRDAHQAEELLQETFLTLWRRRRRTGIVGDSALPWLLVTCRNHLLALRRRAARRPADPLPDELPAIHDDLPAMLDLRRALEALSPDDRLLVELVLVEGHDYADAARALRQTPATLRKRMQRTRSRLREELSR